MSLANYENQSIAPTQRWPVERVILWLVLAGVAIWHRGPVFVEHLRPDEGKIWDFFQEWASARNYVDGVPIYAEQRESFERLMGPGRQFDTGMLPYNAHPPASVLLAVPFAKLSYREAHFAWNVTMLCLFALSIALIIRGLGLPYRAWSVLPTIALVLYCFPLDHQLAQGQLNIVLLLTITLAWSFDRNQRPYLAGAALGLAAAFKLFPAFLFLFFLMRRNWKAIISGGVAFLGTNGLAALMFGTGAFNDYVRVVIPSVDHFRSSWPNLSLAGLWLRMLNPADGERVIPIVHAPVAGAIGIYLSAGIVAALTGWGCYRSRKQDNGDWAYALALVGMLLVSPITWNHYFLILCLPFALLWRDATGWGRWAFRILLILMWVPATVYPLIGIGKATAAKWERLRHELPYLTPQQNLCVAAILTYCLLALFALILRYTLRKTDRAG